MANCDTTSNNIIGPISKKYGFVVKKLVIDLNNQKEILYTNLGYANSKYTCNLIAFKNIIAIKNIIVDVNNSKCLNPDDAISFIHNSNIIDNKILYETIDDFLKLLPNIKSTLLANKYILPDKIDSKIIIQNHSHEKLLYFFHHDQQHVIYLVEKIQSLIF